MAEALGIIASVIAIGALAVRSFQPLLDLAWNVKVAPKLIPAISKDTESFSAIVFSLRSALKEQSVSEDHKTPALFEIVTKLKDLLNSFSETLDKLTVKLTLSRLQMAIPVQQGGFKWHLNRNDITEY